MSDTVQQGESKIEDNINNAAVNSDSMDEEEQSPKLVRPSLELVTDNSTEERETEILINALEAKETGDKKNLIKKDEKVTKTLIRRSERLKGKKRKVASITSSDSDIEYIFDQQPPAKKARMAKRSTFGNNHQIDGIIGERPSVRRKDRMEYLAKWTGCSVLYASWHHEENFEKAPDVIKTWKALSKRQKKRRYKNYLVQWEAAKRRMHEELKDKATQTESESEDSSSNGWGQFSGACPGSDHHWEQVKDTIMKLNVATNFALIKNIETAKIVLELIVKCSLYLNKHRYCNIVLERMKPAGAVIYHHLADQVEINSQFETDSDHEGTSENIERTSTDIEHTDSAGTQTQEEITDESEVLNSESDYMPQ